MTRGGAGESAFKAEGVVTRSVGGETLLVPVRAGAAACDHVFLLNPVAAYLWANLDGQRGREALCALVRERFATPADRDLATDIDHFLEELDRRGLIRAVEPTQPAVTGSP